MVGYNDSCFPGMPDGHRSFATNRNDLLWNINLMGLQTWNSICALNFLESLPETDPKRLVCTGESGGGTQTFILGSIEPRLVAQAPVVMVSHSMQGGCLCENAPGLRVRYSNMEISAAAAPRPQMLVAASGDWTKDTLQVEGPAIAGVYSLLRSRDHFDYARFDFGHNYNQTSREAVYRFFGRWLLRNPDPENLREQPIPTISNAQLRALEPGKSAPGMVTQSELIQSWKAHQRQWWHDALTSGAAGTAGFRRGFAKFWNHTLQLEQMVLKPTIVVEPPKTAGPQLVRIQQAGDTNEISAWLWKSGGITPAHPSRFIILVGAENETESPFVRAALEGGAVVLQLRRYSSMPEGDLFKDFYSVYNRTPLQRRVQDLALVCAASKTLSRSAKIILVGVGQGGVAALMAGSFADAVAADGHSLGLDDEEAWLKNDRFCPGILSVGGIEGAIIMACPRPVLVYQAPELQHGEQIRTIYRRARAKGRIQIEAGPLESDVLVQRVLAL
jgi:hypothetical protein